MHSDLYCNVVTFMKGEEQEEFHRSADVDSAALSAIFRICKLSLQRLTLKVVN